MVFSNLLRVVTNPRTDTFAASSSPSAVGRHRTCAWSRRTRAADHRCSPHADIQRRRDRCRDDDGPRLQL